jgi:hypothetical protein
MFNIKFTLFITVSLAISAFSTEQAKEKLIYDGDTCFILETPLDTIFGAGRSTKFDVEQTNCWRGYLGKWEIRDSVLYLTFLFAKQNGKYVTLKDIFGEYDVKANWYTGKLTIIGTSKYYPLSTYDPKIPWTVLDVIKGKVISKCIIEGKTKEKILNEYKR